jgi:hypothetical protein
VNSRDTADLCCQLEGELMVPGRRVEVNNDTASSVVPAVITNGRRQVAFGGFRIQVSTTEFPCTGGRRSGSGQAATWSAGGPASGFTPIGDPN